MKRSMSKEEFLGLQCVLYRMLTFIKLALIQLSPDNIVFYLLPYGFKVIFQCFKFSSYSFSNHFHLFGVANVRQRSAYSIGLLFVIGLFLLFQSCLQVVQFLFDIHPQL